MTPLQIRVLGYLLQNQGLALNSQLDSAISTYESLIEQFGTDDIVEYISSADGYGLNDTKTALIELLRDYPVLFNRFFSVEEGPAIEMGDIIFDLDLVEYKECRLDFSYRKLESDERFSNYLRDWAEKEILGDGDISQYVQLFVVSESTQQTLNSAINATNNSKSFMSLTFNGMNNLLTGNFSSISTNLSLLAQDCKNLGNLIDLKNIQYLGHPLALLKKLSDIADGDLPIIGPRLIAAGIDARILEFPDINDNKYLITASRICYEQMKTVRGSELASVMKLFDVAVSSESGRNREIFAVEVETMADLLDVRKLFPLSALTLVTSVNSQTINIFDSSKSPNPDLMKSPLLDQILPTDISRPNHALARSFLQVKNIQNQNLTEIANVIGSLETTEDITSVSNFDKPVSLELVSTIINKVTRTPRNFLKATGDQNTFNLTDFIGSPSGVVHVDQLTKIIQFLTTATASSLKTQWTAIKASIDIQSTTPIPPQPPLPTDDEISDLIENFRSQARTDLAAAEADLSIKVMQEQIKREKINLSPQRSSAATFDSISVRDKFSGLIGFVSQLGEYGKKTKPYYAAYCIEQLVEANEAGQSIIAAMREGRNKEALRNLNIDLDNTISNT